MEQTVDLIEYSLSLSTGERISISELDPALIGSAWTDIAASAVKPIVDLCGHIQRQSIEDAKLGYDTALKKALRDPVGCLLRVDASLCSLIRECPMADRSKCTTRHSTPKKGGMFPICWEWNGSDNLMASIIAHAVVHAWRQKRYVLFVTS